jgi:septation ring formation regulator EzrA
LDEREVIDQLRNGRVNKLSEDMDDIKVTIGEINVKLGNIVNTITELKDCHVETQKCLNMLNLDLAARPSALDIRNAIKKVERHETFFMVLGAAITLIAAKILGFLDKVFS